MKVNKITTQPEFQPVTLQITIESQEELALLKELFKKNVTIPHYLFGNSGALRLSEMMGDIYTSF